MDYDPRTPHDLVVIGSGAAGMAAAIVAHHFGLRPLIVEKTAHFGGSTAVSGGAIWIPDNPIMRDAGMTDDVDAAKEYILSETGNRGDVGLIDAFLQHGPKAISFFNEKTELKFSHRAYSPDYHSDQPGAALGGRVIDALDYDGRRLGSNLKKLRPPIADFTLFGGMMLNRFDIGHFLKMSRSPASAWHATKLVGRYARDRVTHRRATRLVLGAAIAGRMGEELMRPGRRRARSGAAGRASARRAARRRSCRRRLRSRPEPARADLRPRPSGPRALQHVAIGGRGAGDQRRRSGRGGFRYDQ
jgi:hypothetical protein